jgi:hypothetical protein
MFIKYFFATDSQRQKPDKNISLTELPKSQRQLNLLIVPMAGQSITCHRFREEKFLPVGPDGGRKTSRLPPVLQLSVAKKEIAALIDLCVLEQSGRKIKPLSVSVRFYLFPAFTNVRREIVPAR